MNDPMADFAALFIEADFTKENQDYILTSILTEMYRRIPLKRFSVIYSLGLPLGTMDNHQGGKGR